MDHFLGLANTWTMASLDTRHIDFLPTLPFDHLNGLFLGFGRNTHIIFTEQPRHRNVLVSGMAQFISEADSRVPDELLDPRLALCLGKVRE